MVCREEGCGEGYVWYWMFGHVRTESKSRQLILPVALSLFVNRETCLCIPETVLAVVHLSSVCSWTNSRPLGKAWDSSKLNPFRRSHQLLQMRKQSKISRNTSTKAVLPSIHILRWSKPPSLRWSFFQPQRLAQTPFDPPPPYRYGRIDTKKGGIQYPSSRSVFS